MSNIDAALELADLGFMVFPAASIRDGACSCHNGKTCTDPGKHPAVKGWQAWATTDASKLRAFWKTHPHANPAILTGSRSKIVVLDVDPRHAGDESLHGLERAHGRLPETPVSITGGGGNHYYFSLNGTPIANSAASIAPGIDIRGDGGLVIGPGALHASGRRYEWEVSSHPRDIGIATIPKWLEDIATGGGTNGNRPPLPDTKTILAGVPEGQRDATLFGFACRLRAADVPIDMAESLITTAAANCTPPFDHDTAIAKVHAAYGKYEPDEPGTYSAGSVTAGEYVRVAIEHRPDAVARIASPYITAIYGLPGAMKTAVALEVAATKATGVSHVGLTASSGVALVVTLDMPHDELADYLRNICGERLAHPNLRIWEPDGGLHLDDPAHVELLRTEVASIKPELVVFDHFGRMLVSDGYTPKELHAVLDVLGELRDRNIAIIVIDQMIKSNGQGAAKAPPLDLLFGGRNKSAQASRAWYCKVDESTNTVTMTATKRRGAKLSPLSFVWGEEGLQEHLKAPPRTAPRPGSPAEQKVLESLREAASPKTRAELERLTGLAKSTVTEALGSLKNRGEIVEAGRKGRSKLYEVSECRSVG